MSRLQPEVQRRQHEQRDHELDTEVVRVARERVRPEHLLRTTDRAEHVDPRLSGRDRLDQERIEIDAALREYELNDAVHGVQTDPTEKRSQREPVEPHPAPRKQRDARDEESEVEDELDHSLGPLRERLRRVEAVEAGQIEEREGREEAERDGRRAREASVAVLDAVPHEEDEEDRRQHVRKRQRAGQLPLQLVERDGEDRQQEQALDRRLCKHALVQVGARLDGMRRHGRRA